VIIPLQPIASTMAQGQFSKPVVNEYLTLRLQCSCSRVLAGKDCIGSKIKGLVWPFTLAAQSVCAQGAVYALLA